MIDRKQVIYDIERCICHTPDACRDCSKYDLDGSCIDCMEKLLKDAMDVLKDKEGYVSVPFSWLVKFCTHIDFNEPILDADREKLWKQKLKQQFDIDIPLKE